MKKLGLTALLIGIAAAILVPGVATASPPGKIAFISDRGGTDNEIFVMNADGSAQTPLTSNTFNEQDPAWSPDGKQIAFFSTRTSTQLELWVMNADGSSPRQLTFNNLGAYSVDWAPDGRSLIFNLGAGVAGSDNFFLINSDGTGFHQLTFYSASSPFGAHFSPDGTRIVFTNEQPGATPDFLGVMSSAGGPVTNITSIEGRAPDFTADGKRIVFWTDSAPDGGTDEEIMSVAANGTDLRQLTFTAGGISGDDRAPSPSRDGFNRIAFVSRRDADTNREIFIMNADGSSPTQLTFTPLGEENRGPDWEPTAKCQGKVATIVGTAASETLTGGPAADIISGQGGKDQINGLDGNDIVCGDAGKDTLRGGKGKDTLNGGKGKDRTIGGKGKDRCIGGTGKDTAKACEKEKKIP